MGPGDAAPDDARPAEGARAGGVPADRTPAEGPAADAITWRYDIPLLTNRFMLWDFGKVIVISVAVMALLVIVMGLLTRGEAVFLPWRILALVTGIMAGLFAVATLILGNRMEARFTVSAKGVGYEAGLRERRVNRTVFWLGLLARSPTTAGAGALAASRESEFIPWASVRTLRVHRGPRVVVLKNSWRVVMRMYCPPELFERVVAACEAHHRAAKPRATDEGAA